MLLTPVPDRRRQARVLHDGAEAGRVKVIGRAPERLRWELGRREEGPPAFVFEGERRVPLLGRRSERLDERKTGS